MSNSDDGYEMPSDLKHTSKPLWGFSVLHFMFIVAGVISIILWYKLILVIGLDHNSNIFIAGVILITAAIICLIFFELDRWVFYGLKYISRPYRIRRNDAECKNFTGIYGIEGDYFYNRYGDLCTILKLIPMNSNRIDPDKQDVVESNDKKFLNALPCPIQIVGYTYNYNLSKYYTQMLKYAQGLPKNMKTMLVNHLDFYSDYCDNLDINEKVIYMIVSVPSGTAQAMETLNMNTDIIQTNLISCGVFGVRQTESEIANIVISASTGIGNDGVDYLTQCTDVEE